MPRRWPGLGEESLEFHCLRAAKRTDSFSSPSPTNPSTAFSQALFGVTSAELGEKPDWLFEE